jgi:hypothetical protein
LFKKNNVGFVSVGAIVGVVGVVGIVGVFMPAGMVGVVVPGILLGSVLGAAWPATPSGAPEPAAPEPAGLLPEVGGVVELPAGADVAGLVVVMLVAVLPAALDVLAAVGGIALAPAAAGSAGVFESSLPQLMAARRLVHAIDVSHVRLAIAYLVSGCSASPSTYARSSV